MQLSNITENRSLWKRWCRNLNDATWPEVLCRNLTVPCEKDCCRLTLSSRCGCLCTCQARAHKRFMGDGHDGLQVKAWVRV